ncbi:hypothetical protein C0J52_15253, partial [Blattella germanica]
AEEKFWIQRITSFLVKKIFSKSPTSGFFLSRSGRRRDKRISNWDTALRGRVQLGRCIVRKNLQLECCIVRKNFQLECCGECCIQWHFRKKMVFTLYLILL